MNLLLITIDDLRPELNCFGKQKLKTPNIDRLAERSVRFERAYCNFPQCMPSRASLMTGVRPKKFCSWSNELLKNGEPTLPAHLRANGYKTVSVGKNYHEPLDDAFHWDELHLDTAKLQPRGGMAFAFHDFQREENQERTRSKFSMPYAERMQHMEKLPPLYEFADAEEDGYLDARVASKAIERLRGHQSSNDDRPLFLATGFFRPHLPWVAPKKYWDLYDGDSIDLADNPFFPENGVGKGDLVDLRHYFDNEIAEKFSDIGRYEDDDFPVFSEAKQRELIHAYWAAVSFMDAQVGRLLDELEAQEMLEDTAILFWGDNGYHLGEHKLWTKVTNFEESLRVPMMLSVPGKTTGTATRALVECIDAYPSLCAAAGIPVPPHLEGCPLPLEQFYFKTSHIEHDETTPRSVRA